MFTARPTPGVSYQLYSSRNFPPAEATIALLGRTGYDQAEGYPGVYDDAARLRQALDAAGMTMSTGHFPLEMLEGDLAAVIDIARTLGMSSIVCPWLDPAACPAGGAGWQDFGRRLERIGARLAASNLRFGWHNHDFELRPLPDGSLPLDHILAAAPGLFWQFDVAWSVVGGQDPIDLIARHGGRILSAHVKDIAPEGTNTDQDGWTIVGHGTLDWATLVQALRQAGCEHFVIEHDNPADDRDFAAASVKSVRGYLS